MPVLKLTEDRIRRLPLGSGIWRDETVKGLMVVCHKTTKTYAVQGDVRRNKRHVRSVRVKVDRCDRIGLAEARRRAKALMSQIQSGEDPTAGPAETGMTLKEALEAHLSERELRPATEHNYRYDVDYYLKGLRRRAIADITRTEVRDLFEDLQRRHSRIAAGGALRTLRLLINTARRIDETIGANPVDAVRIPTPGRREVGRLDVADWWLKTEQLPAMRRDLHRAFLLTGARRTSMLTVRREEFDADVATLTFKHLKTGGSMTFPTGRFLTEMLRQRVEEDAPLDSEWLWPSPASRSGHVEEPKERGLPSAHALRHHCRTMLIAAGVPYAEGALLLAQRLPGASGGYVHSEHLVEALRPHAQALEDLVLRETDFRSQSNSVFSPAV